MDTRINKYENVLNIEKQNKNLDIQNYKEICDMFLSLDLSNEKKYILSQILFNGQYNGKEIGIIKSTYPRTPEEYEALGRLSFAYLYLKNPETFMELVRENINLYHGTNSDALPSILTNGLMSHQKAIDSGIEVTTGEEFSRKDKVREFVSFSDILEVAETYSLIGCDDEDKLLSFPVVIGVKHDYNEFEFLDGEVREFCSWKPIAPSEIDAIMVPSSKVEVVSKMIGDLKVKVLPLDDVQKKFYSMRYFGMDICQLTYDTTRFNSIKQASDFSNCFDIEDIKCLVYGSLMGDIHKKQDNGSIEEIDDDIIDDDLGLNFFFKF